MTLELLLNRLLLLPDRTIGQLTADDVWSCWTLEDAVREVDGESVETWKVPGKTAIPGGRYRVTLEASPRFGADTLTIHDVPGFAAIRMHGGNDPADTEGCPLLGTQYVEAMHTIRQCAPAVADLKAIVRDALADRVAVWITITNPERPESPSRGVA